MLFKSDQMAVIAKRAIHMRGRSSAFAITFYTTKACKAKLLEMAVQPFPYWMPGSRSLHSNACKAVQSLNLDGLRGVLDPLGKSSGKGLWIFGGDGCPAAP